MANDARVGGKLMQAIKSHAGAAIAVGIVLILTGIYAICSPFLAGASVTIAIGAMLLVGGVSLAILAFRIGAFGTGLPVLLMSVLLLLAGYTMVSRPVESLGAITLLLASYLIVSGVVELMAWLRARPEPGSGWLILTAVVSVILGIMLWRRYPSSAAWAIGTIFGVKLLMNGITMTSIGITVRRGARGIEAAMKA
jgi:uncharacterized membrane protein HdeD (DUF308 family)